MAERTTEEELSHLKGRLFLLEGLLFGMLDEHIDTEDQIASLKSRLRNHPLPQYQLGFSSDASFTKGFESEQKLFMRFLNDILTD